MYMHRMARLIRRHCYLTPAQAARLTLLAAQEHCSESAIIRAALDERLAATPTPSRVGNLDPLWKVVALGRSSVRRVSAQVDEYLYLSGKRRIRPCR
jgi:hypothetical protein